TPLHASRLTRQDPAGASHVARNNHRLTNTAIRLGTFGMARRKCPRCPLAMDPDRFGFPSHVMHLFLGNVMRHVVDYIHAEILPACSEYGLKDFPRLPAE